MSGHKPKIPRVIAGIAMHALPLDPMEGFVLSRIDATATVTDIADLTSLDVTEVQRIIDKLIGLGAVEWADGAVHLPRTSARSVAPPRPSMTMARASQAPPAKVSEVHSSAPPRDVAAQRAAIRVIAAPRVPTVDAAPAAPAPSAEMPTDGIEMALDRRKRIDDLYVAIDLLDHYSVLGISQKASKAEVRSAYFELSKIFHPDTSFRKNVGNYRTKMEAIFKKLTEAYEVLGKKKARDEYDAYLASIGETRDVEEAISVEKEIPPELLAPPPPPVAPSPPPAPMPARTTPTDEGKRVARELLQKRLGAMRSATSSQPSSEVTSPGVETAPAAERTKKEVLRDLTSTLRATASHTGGLDRVARLLADGQHAEEQRDLAAAVRAYRLAMALAPERVEIAEGHERLARELAVSMAPQYETQAAYEEKHQKWSAAATSWGKVVEGRPDDPKALVRASIALLEAKGDLHLARRFAQHAVDVAPDDLAARFALGRVFHAAGLWLNAKRELDIVRRVDPTHAQAASLLKDIAQHL